jgi:hypothetical protein
MTSLARFGLLGLCLVRAASAVQAQGVEVRLREDTTSRPIAGAIARLIRNDSVVFQTLSNEQGLAILRAGAPGSYYLRVDRIGFTGFRSNTFTLEAGATLRLTVPVPSQSVVLPEIVVKGEKECRGSNIEGAAAAQLWEEIRKALTANVITQEERGISLRIRNFERELSSTGNMLREWVYATAMVQGQPYSSMAPRLLKERGFIYAAADTTYFWIPDARLLLSDEFVSTHCFRAVPGPASRVGLAFEPVPNRKLPDVTGTLWVNRITSELHELEYEYTGVASQLNRIGLGGRVEFQRLPGGSWIVSYWTVRMPRLETFDRIRYRQSAMSITRVANLIERGGRAAVVSGASGGGSWDKSVITGQVIDSLSGNPLAGVVINVAGALDSAVTSSMGEFALGSPRFGLQLVVATHPLLTVTGAATQQEVVLSLGDTTSARFAVPSIETLARGRCGNLKRRAGVVGAAWTPEGTGDRYASLAALWRMPSGFVRTENARPDERGAFAFCDLPPDQPVTFRLLRGKQVLHETTIKLGWAEFQWLDLRPTVP